MPKFVPREYQELIHAHILDNPRCAVWAGMGLGKTSSTLLALSDILLLEKGPALVLAPLRVAQSTWPEEVQKWDDFRHLRVSTIVGDVSERTAAANTPADIYTTNYENVPWLVDLYGDKWPFTIIVADEATRLKSFRLSGGRGDGVGKTDAGKTKQTGKRARSLARVAHHKVRRFIELTGTPSPNGLMDLWGQIWFIDLGKRLGRTMGAFKDRWFRAKPSGYGVESLPTANAEIQNKLKDICITIDAKDWFDLKEPIESYVYVDLPPRARQLYKDMEKEMFMQLDEHEVEAFNAAAKTQKLLQLASGAVYIDPIADCDTHPKAKEWRKVHDAKLDALEDIIEEANGAPVLVAYHFKSDLARLTARFKKGRQLDKNPKTIKDWNAGKIPILFAHPASAGHGLNLQDGGNILVFFSHDWSLENRLQIIERIGPVRQAQAGYDRPVFIYNIVARGTADSMVIERVRTKREVQDILLDAMRSFRK